MKNSFLMAYRKNNANCLKNDFNDNWDEQRFGSNEVFVEPPKSIKGKVKQLIKNVLSLVGLYHFGDALVINNIKKFQETYEMLHDDESKNLMVQVLSFRALGHRKVKLPTNNQKFWDARDKAKRLAENNELLPLRGSNRNLHKMNVSSFGYDIDLFFVPNGAVCLFFFKHYECEVPDKTIKAETGDVVIDAGGCWGDTALYFANEVSKNGKVYSFEFMPDNLEVFERNMSLNPELSQVINIVPKALWSTSGNQLFVEGYGPSARIVPHSNKQDATRVETITIDDLVRGESINQVNFIKMDIEGAELEALHGAENTIRQFRPKLAISIYHKLQDFWEIPQYINGLGLGYKFALKHATIHAEETVLFAWRPSIQ